MFNKILFFLPLALFSAQTYTVGLVSYNTTWTLQTQSITTTNLMIVDSAYTAKGPQAILTYTYNPSLYVNPPSRAYALSSVTFPSSGSPINQILYSYNGVLSQFSIGSTQNYQTLSFTETYQNQTQLLCQFANSLTGTWLTSPLPVFDFQPFSISQIQFFNPSNDVAGFSALFGPNSNAESAIQFKIGSSSQFLSTGYLLNYVYAQPQNVGGSVINGNIFNVWNQIFSGGSSVVNDTFINNTLSSPFKISDDSEISVNFFEYYAPIPILIYGDQSNTVGSRLAAVYIRSNLQTTSPIYLTSSYTYNSFYGSSLLQDLSNNLYPIWINNSGVVQLAKFNLGNSLWSPIVSAATSFSPSAFPQIVSLSQGLFLTNTLISGGSYNLQSTVFNNTSLAFSTPIQINTQTFTSAPGLSSTLDTNGNVVSVYSGSTSLGQNIFYNVFNPTLGTYYGQVTLNSDSPLNISVPLLVNQNNQILVAWSENLNGSYSLFAAAYNPSTRTFGTPTLIAAGLTTSPVLLESTNTLPGFIFSAASQ